MLQAQEQRLKRRHRDLFRWWASLLWIVFVMWLFLVSALGCTSAVQSISADASHIDELSRSSEQRFETIASLTEDETITNESQHGIAEQQDIQDSIAGIREELPRVEDRESWLAVVAGRATIAGILVAIVLILWQTGLGSLVRRIVYSVSWFIPQQSMRAAEMDQKVADPNHEMTIHEAIASRRSEDQAYNSAYERIKNKGTEQ